MSKIPSFARYMFALVVARPTHFVFNVLIAVFVPSRRFADERSRSRAAWGGYIHTRRESELRGVVVFALVLALGLPGCATLKSPEARTLVSGLVCAAADELFNDDGTVRALRFIVAASGGDCAHGRPVEVSMNDREAFEATAALETGDLVEVMGSASASPESLGRSSVRASSVRKLEVSP